jgi:hypothetical protein
MGIIQLLTSLWPFFKEMFVGDRIRETPPNQRGSSGGEPSNRRDQPARTAARWCIDKMQKSRRFLASVMTLLIISLFINYKVVSKLNSVMPRNEEQVTEGKPASKEPKEVPTIPRKDVTERDVLLEQTVRELKDLYGESR